jgi:MFS transporter, DHA3 family, macrolide efflux protein
MQQNGGLRTFYTIVATQAFSMIGSRMSSLAIGIWLFQQTGDVTPLALVAFFAQLPFILGANIAGMVADRYNRRLIMVLSDTGQAICTGALLLMFATGSFQVEYLYVIAFVQSLAGSFQSPAFSASITTLVPDAQRDRANALTQMMGPAAGIIAPAAAAALYQFVSVQGVILFDLFTFTVAMAVIFFAHIPQPQRTDAAQKAEGSFWSEFTAGFSYLWAHKPMIALVTCACLMNFLFAGVMVVITPYLLLRMDNNEGLMGLVLALQNVGAIVGGVVIGVWGGTRPRIHTVMIAIMLMGAGLAAFGMAQTALMLAVSMFTLMFFMPFANAPLFSIMQAKVPQDLQGRVFAVIGQLAMLTSPISMLLIGPLADNVFEPAVNTAGWAVFAPLVGGSAGAGIGLMALIGGVLAVSVAGFFYALPIVRRLESDMPDAAKPEAALQPAEQAA